LVSLVAGVVSVALVVSLSQVDDHLIVLPAFIAVVVITYLVGAAIAAGAAAALGVVALVVSLAPAGPPPASDFIRLVLFAGGSALVIQLGRGAARALDEAERTRSAAVSALRATETAQARLRVFMSAAPIGMCLVDAYLVAVQVNEAMTQLVGLRAGARLPAARSTVLGELNALVREALRSGHPVVEHEVREPGPDGSRYLLVSCYPVTPSSQEVDAVGVVVQDITERTRQLRRWEVVAAASAALEASPTVEARLDSLCQRLTELWSDVAVTLLDTPRGLRVAAAHAASEPQLTMLMMAVHGTTGGPPSSSALDRVLRGRSAMHLDGADLAHALATTHGDEAQLAALRSLGLTSILLAPLRAAAQPPLGVLVTATTAASGRRLYPYEGQTLEEIAALAVPALQNGLLFERERLGRRTEESRSEALALLAEQQQHIARTLQSALLPEVLPKVEGLDLAAAYRAAGAGQDVGGDVYDAFRTDGALLLLVADVAGKGPEAAAVTAMVRHTVRTESQHEISPAAILRRLNARLQSEQPGGPFCTAVLARLVATESGWRLELARAGHPPALLLDRAGVHALEPAGRLLGVVTDAGIADLQVDVTPGSTIVLHSDGVTDVRHGARRLGEDALRAVLQRCAGDGCRAGDVCQHVLEAVLDFDGGRLFDDVAVVTCHVAAPAGGVARRTGG
jgi:serine phosphatase RsbU (regulator of sigma subunit)/PAS domain-containing protein